MDYLMIGRSKDPHTQPKRAVLSPGLAEHYFFLNCAKFSRVLATTMMMRIPIKTVFTLTWLQVVASSELLRGNGANNVQEVNDCAFCTYHDIIGMCLPTEQLLLPREEDVDLSIQDELSSFGWDCSNYQQEQIEEKKLISIIFNDYDEKDKNVPAPKKDDGLDRNSKDFEKYNNYNKDHNSINKSLTDCLLSGSNEKECKINSNSTCVWCAEPVAGLCVTPKVARSIGKLPIFKCKNGNEKKEEAFITH